MRVEADLDFSVDLGSGPVTGRIEADGDTVRVVTTDAVTVWDAATGVPDVGDAVVPAVADLLAAVGLTVEVAGPRGTVATVGADAATSLLARTVTGSTHVGLGSTRAVLPLARARVTPRRSWVTPRRVAAVVVVAALATAVVILRRR